MSIYPKDTQILAEQIAAREKELELLKNELNPDEKKIRNLGLVIRSLYRLLATHETGEVAGASA